MGLAVLLASIPVVFLALFLLFFRFNRTRIATGFMFTCFLFSLGGTVLLYTLETQNPVLTLLFHVLAIALLPLLLFGAYFFVALLLLNARAVLKREKRRLSNCLTLLLAAAMILNMVAGRLIDTAALPRTLRVLIMGVNFLMLYTVFHLSQYLLSALFCNLSRPRKNQDYIIVLGCWLNEGQLTPLLRQRMDRAIAFYRKQGETGKPPKLICSGGKGPDETRCEAQAMAEYALAQGVPQGDVLTEGASASTRENMVFSKRVMEADSNGKPYRCIYATSNYHLFRAGIYARRAGLKINGIGARTKLYYAPNAILREYIAYLLLYQKRSAVFGALIFGCGVLFGSFVL